MKFIYVIIVLFVVSSSFVLSQSAAKPDTSGPDPQLASAYQGLFGKAWSKSFVQLWNAIPDSERVLREMGMVRFVSFSTDTFSVVLYFDSLGRAAPPGSGWLVQADSVPTFSAQLERWAEFMEGKFNAISGVLTKKIIYKGPMTLAFKYGFQFNKVAPVGKRVAEMLKKK
jgi:putative sterol carrier protein